jgi:hypothetical protein
MKPFEKVLIVVFALVLVLCYVFSNMVLEMYTDDNTTHDKVLIYLIGLIPTGYFCIKYIGAQKFQSYVSALLVSILVWVCLLYAVNRGNLLYYAAIGNSHTETLHINHVQKYLVKGTLEGGKVYVDYHNQPVVFYSSRINYFALLDKKAVTVDMGAAGAGHYYVSKIYWQPGELDAARSEFWHYWARNSWIYAAIIAGVILLVWIGMYVKKRPDAQSAVAPVSPAGSLLLIFKWIGIVFLVLLAVYLVVVFVYFRYGHVG